MVLHLATEVEKKLQTGEKTALFVVDNDDLRREKIATLFLTTGLYEMSSCKQSAEAIRRLENGEKPAVMLLNHHLEGKNGIQTIHILRKKGIPQPTVVYGHTRGSELLKEYFNTNFVYYFVRDPVRGYDIMDCVEKTINGIRPKSLDEFIA